MNQIIPALRLLTAAAILTLGAGCMQSEKAPVGVNSKPGSAAVSHGRSPVATTGNQSTQH